MSGIIDVEDRIRRLRLLRDRIDAELKAWDLKQGRKIREFNQKAGQAARLAKQRAEDERLRAADPKLVRAWAREEGIPVPERGRLKLALREAYLQANRPGGSVDRSVPHAVHPSIPPTGTPGTGMERSTELPASEAS